MRAIYKYDLPLEDLCNVLVPKGAVLLCLREQHGMPKLWYLVDSDQPPEVRTFRTFGTGQPLPDDMSLLSHVGTYQIHGGALVFHVFESYETNGERTN